MPPRYPARSWPASIDPWRRAAVGPAAFQQRRGARGVPTGEGTPPQRHSARSTSPIDAGTGPRARFPSRLERWWPQPGPGRPGSTRGARGVPTGEGTPPQRHSARSTSPIDAGTGPRPRFPCRLERWWPQPGAIPSRAPARSARRLRRCQRKAEPSTAASAPEVREPTSARRRQRRDGAASGAGLVVVEAFLDELLLHRSAVRVEAGELEVLLELEVHVVLAAAVLLDREDHPVAEALCLVRVELDIDLGDDVVLLVHDQDDVGFVVDRRRAAQVEVAQARGLEPFLVRSDDRDHRHFLGQGDVLEAVDDVGDLLRLVLGLGDLRHLLHIVDEHDEATLAGELPMLLDELADVVDRARGLRPAQEV